MKKILSLLLACAMVLSFAACNNSQSNEPAQNQTPAETPAEPSETPATPVAGEFVPVTYDYDSLYEQNFGEFYEYYNTAKAAKDLDTRRALMAVAEAKLLESGLLIPGTASGGGYQMQRISTHGVTTVPYGSDSYHFYQYLVVDRDKMIPAAQLKEINDNWAEMRGTGEFHDWVKNYLTEKGYTLQDSYNKNYIADPNTWDILATSSNLNIEVLCNTYDGLLAYDTENVQQPALATDYEVSEDGTVYTFHLRPDVAWVDSQGREIAKVCADDFVAGMQHLMDAKGGLEWLLPGLIVNAQEYMNGEVTDFSQVGVKAIDDLTVEYTLCEDVPYFTTMLGYGTFAPLCRTYYTSQGGKFGADFDKTAADYTYGQSPDTIAYCGPFLVTSYTAKNSIVFQANPTYWNKDQQEIQSSTWTFNDGTDATRNYNDFLNGKIDSTGLGTSTVKLSKDDGLFDEYVRVGSTGSMSYYSAFNLARCAYSNFNDSTKMVSPQNHGSADEIDISAGVVTSDILDDAARSHAAVNNRHFRLAIAFAFDRGSHMAQTMGEEIKYVRLRNTFVPGDFVVMAADTTIDINGTATTFPAGTYYAEIVQAQLDADGFPAKVYDPSTGADDPSTGFDGWFNIDNAKKEFEQAVAELAAQGVEVSAENPIYLDLPFAGMETSTVNQAEVYRQCMENAFGGAVKINLIAGNSWEEVDNATFYPQAGEDFNMDITALNFGWGADWGDPNSYLDNLIPTGVQIRGYGLFD